MSPPQTPIDRVPFLGLLGVVQFAISIIEIVLVLTDAEGRRLGDKFAGTKVVNSEA